jgi:hypothetical protein
VGKAVVALGVIGVAAWLFIVGCAVTERLFHLDR